MVHPDIVQMFLSELNDDGQGQGQATGGMSGGAVGHGGGSGNDSSGSGSGRQAGNKGEQATATSQLLSPRFVILGGHHQSSCPPSSSSSSSSSSSGSPLTSSSAITSTAVDPSYISLPQPVSFPSEGGAIAHGYYYPPHNPQVALPTTPFRYILF